MDGPGHESALPGGTNQPYHHPTTTSTTPAPSHNATFTRGVGRCSSERKSPAHPHNARITRSAAREGKRNAESPGRTGYSQLKIGVCRPAAITIATSATSHRPRTSGRRTRSAPPRPASTIKAPTWRLQPTARGATGSAGTSSVSHCTPAMGPIAEKARLGKERLPSPRSSRNGISCTAAIAKAQASAAARPSKPVARRRTERPASPVTLRPARNAATPSHDTQAACG